MKHVFILKKGTNSKLIDDIVSLMQGYNYKIHYTSKIEDITIICHQYIEKTRFYVVGGDGFVHYAGNALVHTCHELVVLPYGTGNDYARVLYATNDVIEILKLSLTQQAKPVDVLKCNDIYCINVFCAALDGEVGNIVNRSERLTGVPKSMNYGIGILKKIMNLKFYPICIENIVDEKFTIMALCKGTYFGSGIKAGYNANLHNGMIDINYVEEIKKRELPNYLISLLKGTLNKKEKYRNKQVKELVLHTQHEVNIDGEPYQEGTYHIECIKDALNVVY